jgi:hypothetical protein
VLPLELPPEAVPPELPLDAEPLELVPPEPLPLVPGPPEVARLDVELRPVDPVEVEARRLPVVVPLLRTSEVATQPPSRQVKPSPQPSPGPHWSPV